MSSRSVFLVAIPVWGKCHRDLFTRLALPTHLAPGNLPFLASQAEVAYRILTTAEDLGPLRESESVQRLEALVPVEFRTESGIERASDPFTIEHARLVAKYDVSNVFYAEIFQEAAGRGGAFVSCGSADVLYSDGVFRRWFELVDAGKRVIFMGGASASAEGVAAELEIEASPAEISVEPRRLVRLLLSHPHPFTVAQTWGSRIRSLCASYLYWSVPGEGLLVRGFHLSPLVLWAGAGGPGTSIHGSIDGSYPLERFPHPDQWGVIEDSDDGAFVELSSVEYSRSRIVQEPWTVGHFASCVLRYSELGLFNNLPAHFGLARRHIRLHAETLSDRWSPTLHESDLVIDEIETIIRSALRAGFSG